MRRTLELFECDKCGREGQRYTVTFAEGTLILDRCDTHNKKLEALRNEAGEWMQPRAAKSTFHKSSIDEVRKALQDGQLQDGHKS